MSQTPLNDEHVKLGASFTDFGGWQMPVRYTSDLAEHHAVRKAAGLFDISHMAELFVSGPEAAAYLDYALVGQASAIKIGKAKYSLICNAEGGIIDDLIVYRLAETEYLVIANAGNRFAVAAAFAERAKNFNATVDDQSDNFGLIALQGPESVAILSQLTETDLGSLSYYSIAPALVAGLEVFLCRTGYTGEDGFELLTRNANLVELWNQTLTAGAGRGLVPAGLASRDTLRLEAGMPLYGHELGLDINPYEAGLGKVVRLDRESDFVGKVALSTLAAQPVSRKLVGLTGEGKRAARADYELFTDEESTDMIGAITSGVLSPSLGYPIAMAYISAELAEPGTAVSADVRGTRLPMTVVDLPFYKRAKN